jgi:hypothetical protein
MSLRRSVDRALIEQFLHFVGERYRRPGRLFLVGGTTLVFEGLRQQTMDVDLVMEVANVDHNALIQVVRQAKQALDINVEEASPGDFIPLPAGHANRHVFIGTFGQVNVYHFDLYSTALSKIERGRRQDILDVILLLRAQRLEWRELDRQFLEILPQMELKSLRQDSAEFEKNFRALESQWRAAGGLP